MNRDIFLHTLSQALSSLSAAERDDIVQDYASYFADAMADGQSEADVAAKLGDPVKLARELIAQRRLGAWESRRSPKNLWALCAATAGLGLMSLTLAVPILCYMAVLTLLSVLGASLTLLGLVLVLLVTGQGLFGWPAANPFMLNTSGIGPVWIDSSGSRRTPQIHIQGDGANESFRLDHTPDGGVQVRATEGGKTFTMEKNPDGSIKKLDIRDGDKQVELSQFAPSSPLADGLLGLVLLALGGLLLWMCRRCFSKLLTWLRAYLGQQLQRIQSLTV